MLWWWLLLVGLSVALLGPQRRPETDFATPRHCMNVEYQMPTAKLPFTQPVQLLANSVVDLMDQAKPLNDPALFYKLVGSGHSWVAVGARCLEQDEHALSPDCAPFSHLIARLRAGRTCLNSALNGALDGRWMNRPSQVSNFEYYRVHSMADRIMYRLAMLANKDQPSWNSDAALTSIFSPEQLANEGLGDVLRTCLTTAHLSRSDFQCWPVLMGEPGFTGLTVFDHQGGIRSKPKVTDECPVAPVCGRLAVAKLAHFQALYFDKWLVQGWFKSLRIQNQRRNWIHPIETEEWKHRKCQLNNALLGPSLCWNFSECVPEMLKLVCAEHPACCPDPTVHQACAQDPGSSQCRLCHRVQRPWLRPF